MTRLRDRLAHAVSILLGVGLVGGLVAAVLDLTILDGRIPNGIYVGLYSAFFLCAVIDRGRPERERAEQLKLAAPSMGFEWISEDSSRLPEEITDRVRPGDREAVRNVMATSAGGRRVIIFETVVLEDERWWDDEPSRHDLTCCWMKLEQPLSRFHVEVGGRLNDMKRLRGGWPAPTVDLSVGRRRIEASPFPGRVHDAMYSGDMLTYLAHITHPCHIRIDGDAVLAFTWRREDRRRLIDDLVGFVNRLRPPASEAASP